MGKPVKRMMVYSVVFTLIMMIPAWYFIKMYLEARKMSPLDTQKIIENVYAIKNKNVNMFLIKGDDTYIAVDAGSDLNLVRQTMQALTIDPLKVKAVFLTHSDADHVAALGLFTNAKIYISKAEEQMIKGKASRFKVIHNKNILNYELLDDNQAIKFPGLKVKSIATPGHTPGSMCYVVNDAYLFVGDAMSIKSGEADSYYDLFNMDADMAIQSITKLAALQNIKYVFTAHYGFSENVANVFRNYKSK